MGGHCYYYFVPYEEDINSALQTLRKQEFEAGRIRAFLRGNFLRLIPHLHRIN